MVGCVIGLVSVGWLAGVGWVGCLVCWLLVVLALRQDLRDILAALAWLIGWFGDCGLCVWGWGGLCLWSVVRVCLLAFDEPSWLLLVTFD